MPSNARTSIPFRAYSCLRDGLALLAALSCFFIATATADAQQSVALSIKGTFYASDSTAVKVKCRSGPETLAYVLRFDHSSYGNVDPVGRGFVFHGCSRLDGFSDIELVGTEERLTVGDPAAPVAKDAFAFVGIADSYPYQPSLDYRFRGAMHAVADGFPTPLKERGTVVFRFTYSNGTDTFGDHFVGTYKARYPAP